MMRRIGDLDAVRRINRGVLPLLQQERSVGGRGATGAEAEDADALDVDPPLFRATAHETHRALRILHRLNAMYLDDADVKHEVGEVLAGIARGLDPGEAPSTRR